MNLRGQVDGPDGAALEGVTVSIASQSLSVTTDAEGRYSFSGIKIPATKTVVVTASKSGFKTATKTEKFTAVVNPRLYFRLE